MDSLLFTSDPVERRACLVCVADTAHHNRNSLGRSVQPSLYVAVNEADTVILSLSSSCWNQGPTPGDSELLDPELTR